MKKSSSLKSNKKIIESISINDYEVLTDTGYSDISYIHKTIEYDVYELKTKNNILKCADNHIVFDEYMNEIFVCELKTNDKIIINGDIDCVEYIKKLDYKEFMYDLELNNDSNHRYYTNDILSHNTHVAKMLAKELFNNERDLIRIDMSEYMEKHSVSKLIGAPAGYIGHESGGQLVEMIRNKPYTILLLDEIEKAHPDVYNVFLQVFDDGVLTDGLGRTADFRNTIIIMTSNVGSRESKARGTGIGFTENTETFKKDIMDKELKKKFAPEFLNRIDNIIHFNPLTKDNIKSIIDIETVTLVKKLNEMDINIVIDETSKDFLFDKGYSKEYGARPLKRAIQKYIEDEVSYKIITKEIKKGDNIKCIKSLDGDKLEFINQIDINQIGFEDVKMIE